MIPVGVLSHNRFQILDATLKSLSATSAPSVTVFDDLSTHPWAVEYLYGNELVDGYVWPKDDRWQKLGLDIIPDRCYIKPISGKINVVDVGGVGVVNASLKAIAHLMTYNPEAKGVILVQDDVVFKADWYERMVAAIGYDMGSGGRQGLIAGMTIEESWGKLSLPPMENRRFASAQCYYVSRDFWNACEWMREMTTARRHFDTHICKRVLKAGFEVHLMHPFVCQHIGVDSTIVPGFDFLDNRRYGTDVSPPYAMDDEVRNYARVRELHQVDVSTD